MYSKTAREVFDAWAQDYHADGMEQHHAPRVIRALEAMPTPEGAFLEIGVGNGYALHRMATGPYAGRPCMGIDVSAPMIRKAGEKVGQLENVRLEVSDFLDWQPPEGVALGMIFSMEVFYYLPDIQAGIDRAASLLRPGGVLAVLVNHYREHEASHEWAAQLDTPMQLWSAEQYRAGFSAAGLEEVQQLQITDDDQSSGDPGTLTTWGHAPRQKVAG
jgi:trans-aconitate methyltransferase